MGVKALCRLQLDFSTFNELCGCHPQQRDPEISFQRATHCLSSSLRCLGISMEPSWPTAHLNTTQSQYRKTCLVVRGPVRAPSPPLLGILFRISSCILGIFPQHRVSIPSLNVPPHMPSLNRASISVCYRNSCNTD